MTPRFSIQISTRNRRAELEFTLSKINNLIIRDDVECILYDDGSTDGTSDLIRAYPRIKLLRNEQPKGYMFCRNHMLNNTDAEFAISLDDDAHFLTEDPLEQIEAHFSANPICAVTAFRLFWGKVDPDFTASADTSVPVRSFVGCGHAWRISAWIQIPDYPEWFEFYGEEDYASYELFKAGLQVHYLPVVLVHHRADLESRRTQKDYVVRLRRSLRSGWYLWLLFQPLKLIPGKLMHSVWQQLTDKVFRGDMQAFKALALALADVAFALPKIIRDSNRLSASDFQKYLALAATKIYWKQENS